MGIGRRTNYSILEEQSQEYILERTVELKERVPLKIGRILKK